MTEELKTKKNLNYPKYVRIWIFKIENGLKQTFCGVY